MNKTMDSLPALSQREEELKQQITELMNTVKPLKQELETVTEEIYRIRCKEARELSVWELRVNPSKTLKGAGFGDKITLCSGVTWQQMYEIAVKYFDENEITEWKIWEHDSYKDSGQFHYKDGYSGGAILGVFDMVKPPAHIIRANDYEEYS